MDTGVRLLAAWPKEGHQVTFAHIGLRRAV
jgi:hypothetical protein